MPNQLVTTVDVNVLQDESRIYGRKGDSKNLTAYQTAINKASFELAVTDTTLIKQRGNLLEAARKQVNIDGYQYAKKQTRSKVFGQKSRLDIQSQDSKKARLSSDVRTTRIRECQDDLENIDMQLKFAERAREKFANVHQYQSAIGALKEIKDMRDKKRDFQRELEGLQKREAKALIYKKKRPQKKEKVSTHTSTSSTLTSLDTYVSVPENSSTSMEDSETTQSDLLSDSGTQENNIFSHNELSE